MEKYRSDKKEFSRIQGFGSLRPKCIPPGMVNLDERPSFGESVVTHLGQYPRPERHSAQSPVECTCQPQNRKKSVTVKLY